LITRLAKSGAWPARRSSDGGTRGVCGAGRLPGSPCPPRAKQLFAYAEKYHSSGKKNNDTIFIFLLSSND